MRGPDSRLDSIIERIVLGEELTWEQITSEGGLKRDDPRARSLLVLSNVDRFHRHLHGGPDDERLTTEAAESPPPLGAWGPLHVRERLGRGGFGDVFRAWDPGLEREVALKLLRDDLPGRRDRAKSILDEARTLARIRHENVVTVHGVETHDGRAGYWMELVEGDDLETLFQRQGPLSAGEAAHVGATLCRALAALHQAGLVHRDVKPKNIVREVGGRLVLMDFGTAVEAEPASSRPHPISGTPLYMAPEVLAGSAPDPRSDVYSLGVLLFRAVTGEYPLEPMPLDALQRAHEQGLQRPLRDVRSDLPTTFCEVIERAIHLDPERRHQTAGELELALSGVAARPAPPRRTPHRALLSVALALLLVAASVVWNLRPTGTQIVVDASLRTLRDGEATVVGDGATIAVGDALWLELTASREAYVYVLNRDQMGEVNLLFPLSGYDLHNPLPANETQELPGRLDRMRKAWRVSSDGGREEFLIVVSVNPLHAFESSLAMLPEANDARVSSALALGRRQLDELVRGVGGTMDLEDHRSITASGSDVFESAQRLGVPDHPTDGPWVRKITLVHRR